MRLAPIVAFVVLPILLSGCSRLERESQGSVLTARIDPANATSTALAATDLDGFVGAGVLKLLSEKDKMEAASAQFYALQFGRPGAPRQWQGDGTNSGKVTVGPYVRVNNLDCREFSTEVSTSGGVSKKSGTACREADGRWTAAAS